MGKYTAAVDDHLILPARVLLTPGQEHQLHRSGKLVPSAVPVRLIIDTGSGRSALIPPLITQLQPMMQSTVRVETSLASAETSLYWVRLEFPDTPLAAISELAVACLNLPSSAHAFHGVIGRDLLRQWEYLYFQGRRGRLTIRDHPWNFFRWLWRG